MTASLSTLSLAEAFAAIPLAAVCCDQRFAAEEAKLIREQLLTRAPYRSMEPYAFGVLFSGLLGRFRAESWQGLVAEAAPLHEPAHRDTAYALACQLVTVTAAWSPPSASFWLVWLRRWAWIPSAVTRCWRCASCSTATAWPAPAEPVHLSPPAPAALPAEA